MLGGVAVPTQNGFHRGPEPGADSCRPAIARNPHGALCQSRGRGHPLRSRTRHPAPRPQAIKRADRPSKALKRRILMLGRLARRSSLKEKRPAPSAGHSFSCLVRDDEETPIFVELLANNGM